MTLSVPMYSQPQYGVVSVIVNNGCGGNSPSSGITVYPAYGCTTYTFSVFPNPTTNELTVELTGASAQTTASANTVEVARTTSENTTGEYVIELSNDTGQPVTTQTSVNGVVKIDTASLPKGFYYLKITFNNEVSSYRVVKN